MIQLTLLTPESSETVMAEAVFLPAAMGQFEVLPGHAPIVSLLEAGEIVCRTGGGTRRIKVDGGVARYSEKEGLTVCTGLCED